MALQHLKSKRRLIRLKIGFYFSLLIILDKDASFFLAIQKPYNKDFLKNEITKKRKFFKQRVLAYFKRFKAYHRNGTKNDFPQLYANTFKIILAALEAKIFRFLWCQFA